MPVSVKAHSYVVIFADLVVSVLVSLACARRVHVPAWRTALGGVLVLVLASPRLPPTPDEEHRQHGGDGHDEDRQNAGYY